MPKVTYILGAGASAGEKDAQGNRLRGVPTICEFTQECQSCIQWISTDTRLSRDTQEELTKTLQWLYDVCINFPTVDTYAKQLFATYQRNDYEFLKRALSLFLTICQLRYSRDLRYDGWIASLVDNEGFFPDNLNVLSWNYDAQFEMAYRGYWAQYDLKVLWGKTNVLNKSNPCQPRDNDKFSFVKLNGTAFYHLDTENSSFIDMLVYPQEGLSIEAAFQNMLHPSDNVINELSYVWEDRLHHELFEQAIKDKVKDTEIVVTIGYSFPYVNRPMDKFIFASMPKLKRVYVQDLNAENVAEMVQGRLAGKDSVEVIPKKNLAQFYIPNELD